MAKVINTTFQFKRGLAEAWERVNPILAAGEPGWTLDTHVFKIGDGITAWNDLKEVTKLEIEESKIEEVINEYLEKNPISVKTDASLSVAGQPADAAAVRESCVLVGSNYIFCAGDADDNTF